MNQSIIKKISSGYYQGNYKGVNYTICKVDLTNENSWYWQINNETVNDHHSSKKIAILAVEEWIDDTYDVNTLQKLQKEQETQEIKSSFQLCMEKGYNTKDVIAIHTEAINEIKQ